MDLDILKVRGPARSGTRAISKPPKRVTHLPPTGETCHTLCAQILTIYFRTQTHSSWEHAYVWCWAEFQQDICAIDLECGSSYDAGEHLVSATMNGGGSAPKRGQLLLGQPSVAKRLSPRRFYFARPANSATPSAGCKRDRVSAGGHAPAD